MIAAVLLGQFDIGHGQVARALFGVNLRPQGVDAWILWRKLLSNIERGNSLLEAAQAVKRFRERQLRGEIVGIFL